MSFLYVFPNLINAATPLYSSSEDDPFVLENLYNIRPSFPFRFTGIGGIGNPEWVCVDMLQATNITYFGLFNHNLILTAVGDELRLKGCDDGCVESPVCAWDTPNNEVAIEAALIADFRNICMKVNLTRRYYRVEVIDQNNPQNVQLGELVLGNWHHFQNAYLVPGTRENPYFYEKTNITAMGQIWNNRYSDVTSFTVRIKNFNDPAQLNEIATWLRTIKRAGGKFVMNPDDTFPFCYYVFIKNISDFSNQLMRGLTSEIKEFTLELLTLTEGIQFVG